MLELTSCSRIVTTMARSSKQKKKKEKKAKAKAPVAKKQKKVKKAKPSKYANKRQKELAGICVKVLRCLLYVALLIDLF